LEVCDALDLDVDGSEVADSDETWRNALVSHRVRTVVNMSDDPTVYRPLLAAVRVLDDPDATVEQVRESLAACADSELVDLLADALIDRPLSRDDEQERLRPSSPGYVFDLVHRATAVANRPREITTAEYLAAVLYERCSEPELAESHLRRALDAQPRLGPAIERLGWYHFDRGDARRALQHWQQLVDPPEAIETAEEFARLGRGGGELGRNDPCWCGSGKKVQEVPPWCRWRASAAARSCRLVGPEGNALDGALGW
ncbi:MAG: SEC-C metal-binding domain-containing protein, partial [Acidimicrobiales bacterium]